MSANPSAVIFQHSYAVAVVDREPDARNRLARAGMAIGFTVAFPSVPEKWAMANDGVVLLTIETSADLGAIERLLEVNQRIVVVALLANTASDLGPAALRHGANVVLDRSSDPRDVILSAHLARRGAALVPARILHKLIAPAANGPGGLGITLDDSERALLQDLADGATIERMARHRHQATRTVERHLRRLYLRIGAASRAQAVAKASRLGLVRID